MGEKFVLVLPGGANAGIFGAGIGAGIIQGGLYDQMDAIHGVSCGAFNAAFLAAKQSEIGHLNYTEELTRDFVHLENIPYVLLRGIHPQLVSKKKNILNIDRAIDIVENGKYKLNMGLVVKSKIPVYVTVWNLDTRESEFIDLRYAEDPFLVLKATSCALPYYWAHQELNGNRYADPYLRDPLSFERILRMHKGKKIVIAFNSATGYYGFSSYCLAVIEGLVARRYCPKIRLLDPIMGMQKFNHDLRLCFELDNVLVIMPPQNLVGPTTTDKVRLIQLYKWGIEAAKKIPEFLKSA